MVLTCVVDLPLPLGVDEKVAHFALLVKLVEGDWTPGRLGLSLKDDGGLLLLLGCSHEPIGVPTGASMQS